VRTVRLAHRGDTRQATENTIDALLAAMEIPGCDGVELDVRITADGVPVVIHDRTLERVWGRPEAVDTMAASALEEIGIPSLADALVALPRRAMLDIELKGRHDRAVIEVLAAGRGAELRHAVVSSFRTATLERVAGLAPTWPRWLNADDLAPETIRSAAELECVVVAADWRAVDPGGIERAKAAGLEVAAWTVRRRPTYDRLVRQGVVAVCAEGSALDG
jgi:glycerophosphoryl diester phosphodiesterase